MHTGDKPYGTGVFFSRFFFFFFFFFIQFLFLLFLFVNYLFLRFTLKIYSADKAHSHLSASSSPSGVSL